MPLANENERGSDVVGRLEAIVGSMFSGKTEELIRRVKRAIIARRKAVIIKPAVDKRYSRDSVSSHDGRSLEAIIVDTGAPWEILKAVEEAEVVAIDEVQFFPADVVEVIQDLVDRGKRVLVSGLDMDFARRPFGPVPVLLSLADEVVKLKAICVKCGEPATFTQRLIDGEAARVDDPIVLIGGQETYEARCRICHQLPGVEDKSRAPDAPDISRREVAATAGGNHKGGIE